MSDVTQSNQKALKPKTLINKDYYAKNRNKYLNLHKQAYRHKKLNQYQEYLTDLQKEKDESKIFNMSRTFAQEKSRVEKRIQKLNELIQSNSINDSKQ